MNTLYRTTSFQAIAIFCCALILFTVGLCHQEIIGFESRFYLFALEMWQQGPSWFPTTYHQPYPDYPATTTLFIYGVAKLVGTLNRLVAIFPSAVAAAVTVAFTFLIGALRSQRWGWLAVGFLLLTNTFLMEARTISPDQYVAMVTVIVFYLIYSATLLQRSKRLWFIPFLLALGFACRGPIGLVVPAGVICTFYLLEQNFKRFLQMSFVALAVLIVACVLLLFAAYHLGGIAFVKDVIDMEVIGRLQAADLPWYFYFTESIGAYALCYPLVILMLVGVGRELCSKHVSIDWKFLQKLLAWGLIILVGLTIPAGKKIRYILAFSPALALFAAYLFIMPQPKKYLLYLRNSIYWLCYFLPLAFILLVLALVYYVAHQHITLNIPYSLLVIAMVVLLNLNFIARKNPPIVVLIAALSFVIFNIGVVERINQAINKTHNFVVSVEKWRMQKHADLVFYHAAPDGMPIKYRVNMPQLEMPIFIATPEEITHFSKKALFVTSVDFFAKIPPVVAAKLKVIATGRIGHDDVVVFEKSN